MIKNVKWICVVLIISSLISFSVVGKNTPTEGLTIGEDVYKRQSPDRVVVGVESERAKKLMTKLYKPFYHIFVPAKNTPKLSGNVFIHTQDSDLFRATGNPAGISEE